MPAYSISDEERLADSRAAMRLIMPDVLEVEREVAHEKWFAYRFKSPLAATKLFASLYRQGFRKFIERHKDRGDSQSSNGLSSNLFDQPSAQLTRVWKARQHADRHCLPYNLLIDFGFEFAGRRKWRHAPTPDQMCGSRESVEEWTRQFEPHAVANLPLIVDTMPAVAPYQSEHYRGLADQDEFRRFLLDHISAPGKSWSTKIANHCVKSRHLPLKAGVGLVAEHLRQSVVSDIRHDIELGLVELAPKVSLPEVAFAPACLGIVPAYQEFDPQCAVCALSKKCRELRELATTEMLEAHGSLSPLKEARLENEREKTKWRVREFRKRKAAASTSSAGAC